MGEVPSELTLLAWVATALLGALVGLTELLARYRDDPWAAVNNPGGLLYLSINALAALAAMAVLASGVAAEITPENQVGRVLLAGTAAAAFFRSSLFIFKVGESDVQVGPGLILQVLMDVVDRAVDRRQAAYRARELGKSMAGVDFEKAHEALPTICFALMQNVSAQEQAQVAGQIRVLSASQMSAHSKSLALGLLLVNMVGHKTLGAAINALGSEIRS